MDNDARSAVAVAARGGAVVTTCDHDHDGTKVVDSHQRKRRDVVEGILRLVRFEMDRNDESHRTRKSGETETRDQRMASCSSKRVVRSTADQGEKVEEYTSDYPRRQTARRKPR